MVIEANSLNNAATKYLAITSLGVRNKPMY